MIFDCPKCNKEVKALFEEKNILTFSCICRLKYRGPIDGLERLKKKFEKKKAYRLNLKKKSQRSNLELIDGYREKFGRVVQKVNINEININRARAKSIIRKKKQLKLDIELVPQSTWYNNVRSAVSSSSWNKIKIITFHLSEYQCEICGEIGTIHPLECHEIWDYKYRDRIQKLIGFVALCPLCHEVKHYGLSVVRGNGERAFKRFMSINRLNNDQAQHQLERTQKLWHKRSRRDWDVDLSMLEAYNITPKRC